MNAFLLAILAVSLPAGQLLFKRASFAMQGKPLVDGFLALLSLPSFYAALAIYGFTTAVWVFILSRMPLVEAYPWMASATVAVPMIGWLCFGEKVGPMFWPGIFLIAVGLVLTQAGGSR